MCLRPLREAIIYISGCPKYESDLNFNEIKRRKTYKLRFQLCIRPIYFPCRFCILAVLALPLNWTVTPVYFKEEISTFLLLAGISYSQMTQESILEEKKLRGENAQEGQPTDGRFYLEREGWDEVFLQMLSETCLAWERVGLFA